MSRLVNTNMDAELKAIRALLAVWQCAKNVILKLRTMIFGWMNNTGRNVRSFARIPI